jgi:hypothetical protein
LTGAASLEELRKVVDSFAHVAADAGAVVWSMSPEDFAGFRAGLELERSGVYAGAAWGARYDSVMMPTIMFNVALVAIEFNVPWGLAFNRCADTGMVIERNGIAVWKGAKHGS